MEQWEKYVEPLIPKLIAGAPKILAALVAFFILSIVIKFLLKRVKNHWTKVATAKTDLPMETEKRINTLFAIFSKIISVMVWGIAAVVILGIIGVDIGPIIAAAGIFGLAISFGSQSLVKDIIAGVFILFENQIRVGDVANINGTGGVVEQINLRTVILRDATGTVHIIPNGNINQIANLTRDWSAFVLDMGVDYKEDPDVVMEVMTEVANKMQEEEPWNERIISAIEMMGVDSFGDSAVVIKCRIKTKPIQQWAVGREYRRRLKKVFDERGIGIPFPHQTLYFGDESKPIELLLRDKAEFTRKIEGKAE